MAPPLHHEHIVRINDPANVAGAWLTREDTRDEQEDNARCSAYRSLDIERIREVRRFVGQPLA